MSDKPRCFSCGKDLQMVDRIGRRDECPHCGADAHVCRNCEFFDERAYNMCREPQADVVLEKDRANYCDYFSPSSRGGAKVNPKPDLLAAAEALFKKK